MKTGNQTCLSAHVYIDRCIHVFVVARLKLIRSH